MRHRPLRTTSTRCGTAACTAEASLRCPGAILAAWRGRRVRHRPLRTAADPLQHRRLHRGSLTAVHAFRTAAARCSTSVTRRLDALVALQCPPGLEPASRLQIEDTIAPFVRDFVFANEQVRSLFLLHIVVQQRAQLGMPCCPAALARPPCATAAPAGPHPKFTLQPSSAPA